MTASNRFTYCYQRPVDERPYHMSLWRNRLAHSAVNRKKEFVTAQDTFTMNLKNMYTILNMYEKEREICNN
ncbi:hypothetical protein T11_14557 [Trichinella zimbabwensis]|uniref:Uncharacterized protein n=1 Tax=Trichinella zimbabwensis TaxID=268475 RepID=A0A0V1I1J7_9BILA|nr:hypothetical protein T11_14557 [Trichinella zimbabwensis]